MIHLAVSEEFPLDHDLVVKIFDGIILMLSPLGETREELVYVVPSEDGPMCSRLRDATFIISLSCSGDPSGLQYAYQFAHECCHWMIGGDLSGDRRGLFWLEETLCELASFYCLVLLRDQWTRLRPDYPLSSVDRYLEHTLSRGLPPSPLPLRGYIESHLEELSAPEYHRGLYSQMALALLPHFLGYPGMWLMLPYLGDLKSYSHPLEWLVSLPERLPEKLSPLLPRWWDLVLGAPLPHSQR